MIYTFLQSNFIQFPFQLLVSELIFLHAIQKRKNYGIRIIFSIALQFVLASIWLSVMEYYIGQDLFSYVILYLGYALLTILPVIVSFEARYLEVLFILAGGYATEHMSFTFSKIFLYVIHIDYQLYGSLLHLILTRYLIYVVGAGIVYCLIIRKKQVENGFLDGDIRIAFLALIVMITAIGFSVYWSYPAEYNGTFLGEVVCPFYGFLCCMLVLWMEYYVLRENNLKHEQEMMEQLLQMSDAQQKSARQAIDIINIKCHDLKHQIKALERIEDSAERSGYLKEIHDAVSIYDATYHTGCNALDYVLREKTLLFNEENVEFSCMVDGKVITFMASSDIYALMGNALDNALECVVREAEGERIISLQIKHHHDMILIHLENRCSREPHFVDGLPVTDKKEKNRHGFGVKSIRYIVEKYDGELQMSVQNGKFCLDILLPRNEKYAS